MDLATTAATGAALVVVDARGVRRVEALGFEDLDRTRPLSPTHGFHLGTLGELLLASLTLRLAEEGRLDLRAPVGRIVPGLPARVGVLTAESLLLHTGGLDASSLVPAPPGEPAPRITPEEALGRLRESTVMAPAEWIRSPTPHHRLLLGAAVEAAAEASFAEVVEDRLLRPLGLTGTVVAAPGAVPPGTQPGFQTSTTAQAPYLPAPFPDPAVLQPQERIWMTASDLGRIVASWLADPDHLEALARPQVADPGHPSGRVAHAPGFRVEGNGSWTASGSGPGYSAWIRLFPERGEALILLTNGGGSVLPRTRDHLVQTLLAAPPEHPPAPALVALAQASLPTWEDRGWEAITEPDASLAGRYRNGSQGVILAEVGGALVIDTGLPTPLRLRPGSAEGTLEAHLDDGRTAMVLRLLRTRTGVPFLIYQGVAHRWEEG